MLQLDTEKPGGNRCILGYWRRTCHHWMVISKWALCLCPKARQAHWGARINQIFSSCMQIFFSLHWWELQCIRHPEAGWWSSASEGERLLLSRNWLVSANIHHHWLGFDGITKKTCWKCGSQWACSSWVLQIEQSLHRWGTYPDWQKHCFAGKGFVIQNMIL